MADTPAEAVSEPDLDVLQCEFHRNAHADSVPRNNSKFLVAIEIPTCEQILTFEIPTSE